MGIFSKEKDLRFNRIFIIILDSLGVGETNDKYNDVGANTFKHVKEHTTHEYKNLAKLGIFNLIEDNNFPTMAYHTKASPLNPTKNSIEGHLEIIGTILNKPLKNKDKTLLDSLISKKYSVFGLGKVNSIYGFKRFTSTNDIPNNTDGIRLIMRLLHNDFKGIGIINLSDFDTSGHNRDAVTYGNLLREFDEAIPHILSNLNDKDLLIITSDHGCDPTYQGNLNTREKVPVFIYSSVFRNPNKLPEFNTFGNIGALIADNFGVKMPKIGTSILNQLK